MEQTFHFRLCERPLSPQSGWKSGRRDERRSGPVLPADRTIDERREALSIQQWTTISHFEIDGAREGLPSAMAPAQVCQGIAADLGISHHAVEKRLKMARIKLGATSSLEAARMLGEAEGYGQAVAQSPDLVSDALPLHSASNRLTIVGVAIMILVGAIVLAVAFAARDLLASGQ
jgi:hypothetical protein